MRTLLVDNYDSYTYNLFQLIASTYGHEPLVLPNDVPELNQVDLTAFDAIVVSPGPGRPQMPRDLGSCLDLLRRTDLPVLGVCLGHQAIGWLEGAEVVPAPQPRHGHLERVRHLGDDLFAGLPKGFTAVRYHSLCVAEPLPADLEATAWGDDGVIMGLRHVHRPRWGVQFHPESIATQHGAALLENFRHLAGCRRRPLSTGLPVPAPEGEPATKHRLRFRRLPRAVDAERAFVGLFSDSTHAFWLDSSRVEPGRSRFSFVGDAGGPLGEVLTYSVDAGAVELRTASGDTAVRSGSIFDVLDTRLRERSVPPCPALPFDLTCGYVGYFGYELKADCGGENQHRSNTADAIWMAASRLVAVDHIEGFTWVVALYDESDPGTERAAERWVAATAEWLTDESALPAAVAIGDEGPPVDPEPWLLRSQADYVADIEECQRQLVAGESYEICLTTVADLPFSGDPLAAYRRLRRLNPAPYAGYLRLGDVHVLCSSPERFLNVRPDRVAESRPIKGTLPRNADRTQDAALRRHLASDAKTRAENLMIVDLVRNDLGRVCEVGTVHVPQLMAVESYPTVHQLVSTVRGRLRREVSAVHAARACFPGGSMTGAPKRRTMEILDRLESQARGVYSGAMGFFGLTGGADLNIIIRTAVLQGNRLTVGAGGAIVLNSNPPDEYKEMVLKARTTLSTIPSAWVRTSPPSVH